MSSNKHWLTIPCPHCGHGNNWASPSGVPDENGYHIAQTDNWLSKCSGCGTGFGFSIDLHVVKKPPTP
ncbi:MAG: hypothetical protein ACHQ03_08690 [Candidatus Bathyarchaeia archaeon]